MDPQTRQVVEELAREMASQRRDLTALKRGQRAPQLAHSSLEEGQALEVRDDTGQVRGRIGWIGGAVGTVTEGGDPVSAPSAPSVTPSLGGLRVTWDGTLSGDLALPADFDHMAVHVSTATGFTPSAATYVGTIRRAGDGGMLPVVPLPYVAHYVLLVPVTTGGVQGTPSAEVTATPLQTSGVDLQADSIEAVHIKAGAVKADKLEAVLALVTTIVAGIPGAARVELDQGGLRGYNELNELVFAIDSAGNAIFTGSITGSEISGSRMSIGTAPGNVGTIEDASGIVRARVTSSTGQRAQIAAADGQSEFTAWADPATPGSPVGGVAAQSGVVALTLQSASGDAAQPYAQQQADAGRAMGTWTTALGGSSVVIQALTDYASILLTAPPATDPADAQGSGYLFTQRYSNDIAAVSMQGPEWSENTGPEYQRRSMLHLEGARPERAYTRGTYSARRHIIQGEWNGVGIDTTSDGVLDIADTHSILAPRHAPARTDMVTAPSGTFSGGWIPFSAADYPPIAFRTGWSGRARVTITAAAGNTTTANSTIHFGFDLTGGSTVPAAVSRAWNARSTTMQCCSRVVYLDLVANADYTLTPAVNISSGTVGDTVNIHSSYEHSIVVEPLM